MTIQASAESATKDAIVAALRTGANINPTLSAEVGLEHDIVYLGYLLNQLIDEGRVEIAGRTPDGFWTVYRALEPAP